jgi:hypothetical protein
MMFSPSSVKAARLAFLAICLAPPAMAQEGCPALGFQSNYLNDLYCQRLAEIVEEAPDAPSRSIDMLDDDSRRILEEFGLIREAYHADPKKTLELIKRIREAGGLTTQ